MSDDVACDRCGKKIATRQTAEICRVCEDVPICQTCFDIHVEEIKMDNAYELLGIIQRHAPNGEGQQIIADTYSLMLKEGNTVQEVEKNMAGILYNGLATGNWPWNT